jgi:hypothetical protein
MYTFAVVWSLVLWVCSIMDARVPGEHDAHLALAATDVAVAMSEPPLFRGDDSRQRTLSLVLAVQDHESGFRSNARNKKTNDHCSMQIHGRPDLAEDPEACVRVGLAMLRESMRNCPEHPVAFYAEGPKGCESERAQKLSADMMGRAKRFYGGK